MPRLPVIISKGQSRNPEKRALEEAVAAQLAEHDQLDQDLRKQMKTCTQNYLNFESELCALKKIRGELMKMKGDGHSGFFQDCEVSKWDPEEFGKQYQGVEQ